MASLTGKVAIVTGASRGIGRAIAERFASEGASVVVNYARSAGEAMEVVAAIEAKGGSAIAIQADIGVVADIRRLFREALAKFGHLDIVVNNAATGPFEFVTDVTEEHFDRTFAVNVKGPLFMMQEAARSLSDRGRIINISTSGTTINPPGGTIYIGSKAAMETIASCVAGELAPRGITVNTILSGAIDTRMLRDLPPQMRTMLIQRTPLGAGETRDIAGVAAFLAGDEGRWITNEKIRVDGGMR